MTFSQQTWLIVGASRGIGLAFAALLLDLGHRVLATARTPESASQLWSLTGTRNGHNLNILECNITDERSILSLKRELQRMAIGGARPLTRIDVCVLNAGILIYPNRISNISFSEFSLHLQTNTIGPLYCASILLSLMDSQPLVAPHNAPLSPTVTINAPVSPCTPIYSIPNSPSAVSSPPIPIHTLVFLSSDSGSTTNFRAFEDGFGAYAASKAALNQGLRHLAAELHRKHTSSNVGTTSAPPVVLAIHPGEVSTDMAASAQIEWEIEGIISPQESVRGMVDVISAKGKGGSSEGEDGVATFWDWEGNRYPW